MLANFRATRIEVLKDLRAAIDDGSNGPRGIGRRARRWLSIPLWL